MERAKKVLIQSLKLGVSFGLLYYLISSGRIDLASLKRIFVWDVLLLGFMFVGVVLFMGSERWRLLMRQQGINQSRWATFKLTLIGGFFSIFVPGGVGGDVVKAVYIAKDHPENRAKVVLTVLADRILGLFTITCLALLSFSFETKLLSSDPSVRFIFYGLVGLFCAFLVFFYLLLSKRALALRGFFAEKISRFPRLLKVWDFAQSYHLSKIELLKLFSFSVTSQLCSIGLFVLVGFHLMDTPPPLSVYLFAVPVGFMVTAVPLAPGGVGVGQAALFYLFTKALGFETDVGAIGITAFQALQLFYGIIGAIFFVMIKKEGRVDSKNLNFNEAQVRLDKDSVQFSGTEISVSTTATSSRVSVSHSSITTTTFPSNP